MLAQAAHDAAAVSRAVSLGGVLDDRDASRLCELRQRVHVRGVAVEVDGDDGLGALSNELGDRLRIQAPRVGIDFGQDRRCADVAHGIGSGDVRQRGDDDLVAGTDVQRQQRNVQRRRAVADGDRVARSAELGELALEALDVRARRRDP